jgi:hypothetical protein
MTKRDFQKAQRLASELEDEIFKLSRKIDAIDGEVPMMASDMIHVIRDQVGAVATTLDITKEIALRGGEVT